MLSIATQFFKGKDGISHQEFNSHLENSQNVDDDHNTRGCEVSWEYS